MAGPSPFEDRAFDPDASDQEAATGWPSPFAPTNDRTTIDGTTFWRGIEAATRRWFADPDHDQWAPFLTALPFEAVDLSTLETGDGGTRYDLPELCRAFLLKELSGWDHETALRSYLLANPDLRRDFGFESVPDQSTLWRAWHDRFSEELRSAIETGATKIDYWAGLHWVDFSLPGADENTAQTPGLRQPSDDGSLDHQSVLERADELTDHAKRIAFPAFELDRDPNWEIPESAFWELQTYAGVRERMAVNEGARSFHLESTRERTPMGHVHRDHVRGLSIDGIREMYRGAIDRLLGEVRESLGYDPCVVVAIDITTSSPFTGDRDGHEDVILGIREDDEHACHWATIQIVQDGPPIILDARPVRRGDSRQEIVEDLISSAASLIRFDWVLMDREFDGQGILEYLVQRDLHYIGPKRQHTTEKATIERMNRFGTDVFTRDRKLHLGDNEWHETTMLYVRKDDDDDETDSDSDAEPSTDDDDDSGGIATFVTSASPGRTRSVTGLLEWYSNRWQIEAGYKQVKQFMPATTSTNHVLRFFYFAFGCLLYSLWKVIDRLVREYLDLDDEEQVLTANDVLTMVKKYTGIG